MSNGAGGYGPGEIVIDSCLTISENEWNSFSNIIKEIDFWNLSPIEKTQVIGYDGAQWILEGSKENTYHMVNRWSSDDKETSKACLYLLELSKLKIEKVY